MKNMDLIRLLETAVSLSRTKRLWRLSKAPKKLIHSKMLELIGVLFDKSFKVEAKTFWGKKMIVILPERVSLSIYRYGFFEEDLTKIVLEHLKPGMTFLDVGSHFGYFTLLSSFIVGDEGRIHAFEPSPLSYKVLKVNVETMENVCANNLAVSSKEGNVSIRDYGIRFCAYNSLYNVKLDKVKKAKPKSLRMRTHNIECIALDNYIYAKNIKPDFIKIDAEGSEYEILHGLKRTLTEIKPIVSIEVGDAIIDEVSHSKDNVTYLLELGYQAYEYNKGKIVKHEARKQYEYDNILFLPN